jgi:hypothetical protein
MSQHAQQAWNLAQYIRPQHGDQRMLCTTDASCIANFIERHCHVHPLCVRTCRQYICLDAHVYAEEAGALLVALPADQHNTAHAEARAALNNEHGSAVRSTHIHACRPIG